VLLSVGRVEAVNSKMLVAIMRSAFGISCLVLLAGSASSGDRFPFVIPGDDAQPSVTDMSWLSSEPAGTDGFVRIRDGKFHTASGRLKIWGINVCFGANFPSHTEAEKVAAHLAKLGINGVRMHHHDTQSAPRGIWKPVPGLQRFVKPVQTPVPRETAPEQLDRQDYFLGELHKRGIYVNLNLHVGRTFNELEGFVSKNLPRDVRYDKYLLYYDPRMRKLFKDFCRQYLTHNNPYRNRRRVDDPGIAMIEITNENAFSTKGPQLAARLPEPYRGEFQRQWNEWLEHKYGTTDALRKAWAKASEPSGADVADMGDLANRLAPWTIHQSRDRPVRPLFGQPGPTKGLESVRLDIVRKADAVWQHELMLRNLTVEKKRIYTLSFWIKAERPRELLVDISTQGPERWQSVGYQETLAVGPEWRQIERTFRATETVEGNARICFKFGGSDSDIFLADVHLHEGASAMPLPDGQYLERGTIDISTSARSPGAMADMKRFMVETEKGFIRDIIRFLKEDLGVKVPVTASQVNYHGPDIVADTCDYADIHAYWQHPRFPGKPWDRKNWYISNTPMECVPGKDTLTGRCPLRLLDRPFTISEWNIPDPHHYGASVVPFAAMVASLQDWDGVFFFTYHQSDQEWFTDRVRGFFSFNGQPAKLALLTTFARTYRQGDIEPLETTAAGTVEELLPAYLALSHRIGVDPSAEKPFPAEEKGPSRLESPRGQVVWDAGDPEKAFVTLNTAATRAVWGLVAGQTFSLGNVRIAVGNTEHDYACIVLTGTDGLPIGESKRILLTAVGSVENRDMGWNETGTSVGDRWGTGPAQVNGIPVRLSVPGKVTRVRPLDGRGMPRETDVPIRQERDRSLFSIGPEYRTLWYEIETSSE